MSDDMRTKEGGKMIHTIIKTVVVITVVSYCIYTALVDLFATD